MRSLILCPLLAFILAKVGASPPSISAPIVKLDYGSFQGNSMGNLTKFLGMPFAAPPLGNLRFAPPQPPHSFVGVRQATDFGAACFQQDPGLEAVTIVNLTLPMPAVVSEDCLFINVVKPANIPAGKKLPIIFWIYGGAFQVGDTSLYPGDSVVSRSIALGEPIIFVSTNYRVSAFGFLGGKEVKAAGIANAGIRDQRFALEWVQKHIAAFGGDSKRVTLWGESAGAISSGIHMLLNNGNTAGLFHGAIMNSGSPLQSHDTAAIQPQFDQLVADTGCAGAADKIACLRKVPFADLGAAVNKSPPVFSFQSLQLTWRPTVDGRFIVRDPQISVKKGLYAKVPIITGDCDDEGTLFALTNTNITNGVDFLNYMSDNYFLGRASKEQLAAINDLYPDDITQGSPFDTGTANALTPESKRLAAIQGDFFFQAPRRAFLETVSKTQPAYSFLSKRGKNAPLVGASHGCDHTEFWSIGGGLDFIGTDALVNFVHTGNPNEPKNPLSLLSKVDWAPWGSSVTNPPLLTFLDPVPLVSISFDTYRAAAMKVLTNISLQLADFE